MKRRKDGRWLRVIKINGKSVPFYSRESTEARANRDIERQLIAYREKETVGSTFLEVADAWVCEYRESIPETSYQKAVKSAYERIQRYFDEKPIKSITPKEIQNFISYLAKKGYSKKTVAMHKSVLNMIFRFGVLNDYVTVNPVSDIRLPPNLPKKKRTLPITEEIRKASQNYKGFALFAFLILNTGCRRSEALALRRENFDFENKRLKITHHVIHEGNRPIYEPVLKTESAAREIILPDRVIEAIPKTFKGFLFSMDDDGKEPLTQRAYDKRWKQYCMDYGVHFTAHQLRHAYATMLHEAGIDLKDAQALMGHSDINLTKQIYTHIRNERMEETAKKINDFSF